MKSFNDFTDKVGLAVKDSQVTVHVKRRVKADLATWTVTLINSALESDDPVLRDSSCLFQSQIVVNVAGEGAGGWIRPRRQTKPVAPDSDALSNQLIYRKALEYAVGHGIAVEWDDEVPAGVASVRTSWLPRHAVHGTDPRGHADLRNVLEVHPDLLKAEWLGELGSREQLIPALEAFARSYQEWIDVRIEARVGEFDQEKELEDAAQANLKRCREVSQRLTNGVSCLAHDAKAWEAFRMSNQAMDRQSRFPVKGDRAGPLTWRPFQLAYIVMVIPSLVDPGRWPDERECMDLLWFPTGGGKTEAYLGLTAFQILHRRLVSDSSRRSGGVDVLMRYTLRLLTVQQFQRAATLICACEQMRFEQPEKLGAASISIGLYVGGGTTPNKMEEARETLLREAVGEEPKSTPRQLLTCPVCAAVLQHRHYRPALTEPVLDITCEATGCPSGGKPLPVLVVDDCIYHRPPSLLIGTVDKFAQLPRKQEIGSLFGIGRGLPPGLIIQDELHLISGPLGSMSGLYEAAIDILCTRDGVRPKIIGSTATIGRAKQQVRALFDRNVLQFPPPGIDADDSFFAVREQASGQDRLYMGISTAGRSPKFALQATFAALLEGTKKLTQSTPAPDDGITDPYWTCVAYFNSLRELGGAHVLVQDDVPRQMVFLSRRLASGDPRPLSKINTVAELSSRVSSRDIPVMLKRLEAPLGADPMDEQPEDVVLASNMISVGVDVPRLGLMLVNGQPKSTSEYIQATSRVGRGLPGLVITLYNFSRPRDLSHFEHFKGYHAALYRAVEASSVTPWAPRARDKALPAVLIGALRHLLPDLSSDAGAARLQLGDPRVEEVVKEMIRRCDAGSEGIEDEETAEELQSIVKRWEIRAANARSAGSKLVYWERKSRFGNTSAHLIRSAEDVGDSESKAWAAPNSMREVEPSAAFKLDKRKGT
ncbi:helicase-related protein [Pseudomonas gingeri]|uniref:helicase-related protein n=1 Tax=Pseudomonas gingeri TaxID=117681 RepID=UPI001C42F8CF|nr:helicase-related protein [Pseudomonas gingeri]